MHYFSCVAIFYRRVFQRQFRCNDAIAGHSGVPWSRLWQTGHADDTKTSLTRTSDELVAYVTVRLGDARGRWARRLEAGLLEARLRTGDASARDRAAVRRWTWRWARLWARRRATVWQRARRGACRRAATSTRRRTAGRAAAAGHLQFRAAERRRVDGLRVARVLAADRAEGRAPVAPTGRAVLDAQLHLARAAVTHGAVLAARTHRGAQAAAGVVVSRCRHRRHCCHLLHGSRLKSHILVSNYCSV